MASNLNHGLPALGRSQYPQPLQAVPANLAAAHVPLQGVGDVVPGFAAATAAGQQLQQAALAHIPRDALDAMQRLEHHFQRRQYLVARLQPLEERILQSTEQLMRITVRYPPYAHQQVAPQPSLLQQPALSPRQHTQQVQPPQARSAVSQVISPDLRTAVATTTTTTTSAGQSTTTTDREFQWDVFDGAVDDVQQQYGTPQPHEAQQLYDAQPQLVLSPQQHAQHVQPSQPRTAVSQVISPDLRTDAQQQYGTQQPYVPQQQPVQQLHASQQLHVLQQALQQQLQAQLRSLQPQPQSQLWSPSFAYPDTGLHPRAYSVSPALQAALRGAPAGAIDALKDLDRYNEEARKYLLPGGTAEDFQAYVRCIEGWVDLISRRGGDAMPIMMFGFNKLAASLLSASHSVGGKKRNAWRAQYIFESMLRNDTPESFVALWRQSKLQYGKKPDDPTVKSWRALCKKISDKYTSATIVSARLPVVAVRGAMAPAANAADVADFRQQLGKLPFEWQGSLERLGERVCEAGTAMSVTTDTTTTTTMTEPAGS